MTWQVVIGLEVHVQLKTKTKIFSGSSTTYGAEPNTQANILDLAMPGVLPVLNKEAVRMAVKFGLAVGAEVNKHSVFARKNYFYPDLPKGYQISQFELPIVGKGSLPVLNKAGEIKPIALTRAHLEEDAGKSLHEDFHGMTGIDLNRAGTPLLEIVSEPDLRSAKEAVAYLKSLYALVCCLDICDGNMQEGSFRCDANVSIHKPGTPFGTRAEIKNLNSFRFVERAINHEIERQTDILESGGTIIQETRLYDANENVTRSMRVKVEANDYRYFPDPDLLPLEIDTAFIDQVKAELPELPEAKRLRFMDTYQLSAYDALILVSSSAMAHFYETTVQLSKATPKLVANWIIVEFSANLNKHNIEIDKAPVTAEQFALLMQRISDQTISGSIAKTVFEHMWNDGDDADTIIEAKGLKQMTDTSALEQIIDEVMTNNPGQLEQYRSGKDKLFGFFVGQVMKASKGKANPQTVNALLKEKL